MRADAGLHGLAHPPPTPVAIGDATDRISDVLPAVVRRVPVGVGIVRRDRTLAYRNDELERILRSPGIGEGIEAPPLGPMHHLDGSAFIARHEPLDRLLATGTGFAGETVLLDGLDGTRSRVVVTGVPIVAPDDQVLGAAFYVEDHTQDPDDALLRRAFVDVLSHEFRTPLTSIYGGMQLLRRDRLPADVRAAIITDIAAETEHLHRLVEDLLTIARIEQGTAAMRVEPVSLGHLAREVAEAEERRWPGRHVRVEAEADLPAAGVDEGLARQILRNLVADAVKYSPITDPVVIALAAEDGAVVVTILDRGPGFPPGAGADAFQLFHRDPIAAARAPGTGLGLYVARTLVEAAGGRVWLLGRPDGGAEVGFTLPVYRAEDVDTPSDRGAA